MKNLFPDRRYQSLPSLYREHLTQKGLVHERRRKKFLTQRKQFRRAHWANHSGTYRGGLQLVYDDTGSIEHWFGQLRPIEWNGLRKPRPFVASSIPYSDDGSFEYLNLPQRPKFWKGPRKPVLNFKSAIRNHTDLSTALHFVAEGRADPNQYLNIRGIHRARLIAAQSLRDRGIGVDPSGLALAGYDDLHYYLH